MPGGPRRDGRLKDPATPREDGKGPLRPDVSVIKETKWGCTQDIYASRSVKARGFKTITNSFLKFLFIVDPEEQLET